MAVLVRFSMVLLFYAFMGSSPSFYLPLPPPFCFLSFFSKYYCGLYHQLNNGNYYKLKIITKLIKNVETKLTVNQNTVNKMIFFFSLMFFFFWGGGGVSTFYAYKLKFLSFSFFVETGNVETQKSHHDQHMVFQISN